MKRGWFKDFKTKFKVVIIHPETYEERKSFRYSKRRLSSWVLLYTLLIVAITTVLIFFTSLRELIPGYTDVTLERRIYNMETRADSIEIVFRQKDAYIENLKRIMNNEEVVTDIIIEERDDDKEKGHSSFVVNYKMPAFFMPIRGLVTNHFNTKNKHYGVDVVANTDAVIKSVADGVVVFSDWSVEGGYVIGIQHFNDIISIYKHNASNLCHEGDVVRAGDAIAVVGSGGSTSTGPHLHFELWFKGKALNPEDYISFEGK